MTNTDHNTNRADWLLPYLPAGAIDFAGRSMLALLFILAGYGKIGGYEGNLAYMASVGLPGFLLPPTIVLELVGGLALVAGFQTRLVALGLALFSLASALLFHAQLGDQIQFIMFFKNVAMAGGLLLVAGKPLGSWTLDRKLGARGAPAQGE
ncbi:DoxX family protein [Parahaliea mediterranea]|uniref:DoxX family protein n=1 Tax=Parahaliea mediterranea TaxID=651086 RepID=A0A939DCQ9_9GAMM|nr:DoxX family protein [Parahaliea mediterranea]MBN7795639.1 DoxX family protein [Parahaliea mediterranea]